MLNIPHHHVLVAQSCPTLCNSMDCSPAMEFCRQEYWNGKHKEYWNGLPFPTPHHEENANQNNNEVYPHTCQIDYYQKTTNNKSWQRKRKTLMCYWWECKMVQPLWKRLLGFLKKLKIELHMI